MAIILKLGDPISDIIGAKSIKVEFNSFKNLREVFDEVNRLHPKFNATLADDGDGLPYNIFRNDTMVYWDKVSQTPVADGDKIFIFTAVSGGGL
jgi:molybdopterin converting factor small subunit